MRKSAQLSLLITAALAASAAAAQQPTDRTQTQPAAAETTRTQTTVTETQRQTASPSNPNAASSMDANDAAKNTSAATDAARADMERTQSDRTRTAEAERTDASPQRGAATSTDTRAANPSSGASSTADTTADRQRQAAAGNQSKAGRDQSGATVPFITVLVPVAMETRADTGLANGCWAKLYGENGFRGDSLTLVGPVDMADMRGPFGVQWDDKVSSIKAGPNATVTIYDDTNYRDKAATVRPREQVQEISEKMGFFEDVESLKVTCAGASG